TLLFLFNDPVGQPLALPVGEFLALAPPRDLAFDLIIPMPLHWRRRFERGFNQSALLARQISMRWHVPVRNLVRRRRGTAPQAGLTNAKRRANVAGAFRMKRGTSLRGQHVLLVDDVLTTGATAAACARVLKRAGAARVTVLALARTDRRSAFVELLPSEQKKSAAARGAFA